MISDRIREMMHPIGFIRLFYAEVRKSRTYEEAFERLNDEYKVATGFVRYKNYDSFRKTRDGMKGWQNTVNNPTKGHV